MSKEERAIRKAVESVEAAEAVIQQEVEEVILQEAVIQHAAETAIQREVGKLIGAPSRQQTELIDDLVRLQQSLSGPEDLLGIGGYSRPIPPRPSSYQRKQVP